MRRAAPLAALAAVALVAPAAARAQREPDPALDVASYTIDARLDASHRVIDATATVRWRNTSAAPARGLWWHLYMNAFAHGRTHFMRTGGASGHRGNAPGAWGRIEVRSMRTADGDADLLARATPDPAVADDATQLWTPLPREVPPGGAVEVRVAFRTVLPAAFARAGYHGDFAFVAQWFPKLAVLEPDGTWAHFPYHYLAEFYADFGAYDVTLTVPPGDVVGATGERAGDVARTPAGDRHRYVAARVHDFAWTAWPRFREREARAGSVRVRVLHPPGDERGAGRMVEAVAHALPALERRFGPYPYRVLTVVVPPAGAGGVAGMEYPTLITTDGGTLGPRALRDAEYVTVHELAHQYFYGLFASDEYAWPFLDEGLAEYATGLVMTERWGDGRELYAGDGLRVGFWAFQGAFSAATRDAPIAQRAPAFESAAQYGGLVYRRTATVMRTAERSYGADGVARALALYAARARFRHPRPEDLLRAFREAMGEAFVAGYLRPALFGDASVDYAVERVESWPRAAGGYAGRAVVRRDGALVIPVDVELEGDDGARARARWDGAGARFVATYAGAVPLRSARVDPDHRVPLDRARANDALAAPGRAGGTAGLVARAAFWIAAALRAVGP